MIYIAVSDSKHQSSFGEIVASGMRVHGLSPRIGRASSTPPGAKTVVCWGWHTGRNLMRPGRRLLVMERGYLGDRFRWTSLGWGGLNNLARFPEIDDPSRFKQHFSMAPWKDGGDFVLIACQVPGDASLGGVDLGPWYSQAAVMARRAFGLPVRYREHPAAVARNRRVRVRGASLMGGELSEALAGAAVVITYNSNTAVDAAIAGVPVICWHRGSMAWPVAAQKKFEIVKPDRERWAARLAWKQWLPEEIEQGTAWGCVGKVV